MPDEQPTPPERSGSLGSELRRTVQRQVDDVGLEPLDYVKAALTWQYNWIGLAGAAAFALVSGTGLPLVLGAGLELMYLSLAPRSSRFRRLVRSWKYAKERREHELRLRAMFAELPPDLRKRHEELAKLCDATRANYQRLSSPSQIFVRQLEDKLGGLLGAYLRLLQAANHHREYVKSVDPDAIKREAVQLQKSLASDAPKVQEINKKRIEILSKRLEKFERIHENRQVIDAQCAAIEEVLELIRDQTVTMRDPQQVNDQLENLVRDVEQTEETVRQVEAIFDLGTPDDGGASAFMDRRPAPTPSPRTRARN
jgi:hypothetical protein